jgi:pimeloyl-ACP methyl ester carboxylesterase
MHGWMNLAAAIGVLALAAGAGPARAAEPASATTIVLVHGAFAGSSSWNPVIAKLAKDGSPVIAAANPLRSLKTDADYVARIVASVHGPVILVGHSYGGEVISMAAYGADNVKGLVFVSGLAPEAGESAASLGERFPTGTLAQALGPAGSPGGWGAGPLYRPGEILVTVRGRCSRGRGDRNGRHSASCHRGRSSGTGRAGRVEDPAVMVHLGPGRQEHPQRAARLHGASGRREGSRRDQGRLARGHAVARQRCGGHDRARGGRALRGPCRRLARSLGWGSVRSTIGRVTARVDRRSGFAAPAPGPPASPPPRPDIGAAWRLPLSRAGGWGPWR